MGGSEGTRGGGGLGMGSATNAVREANGIVGAGQMFRGGKAGWRGGAGEGPRRPRIFAGSRNAGETRGRRNRIRPARTPCSHPYRRIWNVEDFCGPFTDRRVVSGRGRGGAADGWVS